MRTDMLFIDGELVDLDEDTQITLNIKSNLFTDLSKIVSNNSYTIKLPKTVRNQRIIEHADLPACDTDYPREYHQARYFRHGIEIIPDGKAVLVSCTETIDIALTWGNINLLTAIIEGDKTIQELQDSEKYHIIWEKQISNYDDDSPFIVADMDIGLRNYDTKNYAHPSVRVSWLLERISHDNDVNFSFPSEIKTEFIDRLIVPLLTRHGHGIVESIRLSCTFKYSNGIRPGHDFGYYVRAAITEVTQAQAAEYMEVTDESDGMYWGIKILLEQVKLTIRGRMVFFFSSDTPRNPRFVAYKVENNAASEVFSVNCTDLEQTSGGNWEVTFNFNEETSVLNVGDVIYFAFADTGYLVTGITYDETFIMTMLPSVEEIAPIESGISNGYYPILSNLPSIKQIDFLKNISSMCGLFAMVKDSSTIEFVSVDKIVDNKSVALDWTKKVVASFQENKPYSMAYTLDGFARNNYYRYKEDDTVTGNYDAVLSVDNSTIERDLDAVTLEFAATGNRNRKAYIRLYEYDNSEDGVGELTDVEPRILLESNMGGKSWATFTGLNWSTLISKYYTSYQDLIRKPIVIKEKIEISDIDLREIDVTVPVYLAQYGRYYAIISIKAEDTGICECELLQLEV